LAGQTRTATMVAPLANWALPNSNASVPVCSSVRLCKFMVGAL